MNFNHLATLSRELCLLAALTLVLAMESAALAGQIANVLLAFLAMIVVMSSLWLPLCRPLLAATMGEWILVDCVNVFADSRVRKHCVLLDVKFIH